MITTSYGQIKLFDVLSIIGQLLYLGLLLYIIVTNRDNNFNKLLMLMAIVGFSISISTNLIIQFVTIGSLICALVKLDMPKRLKKYPIMFTIIFSIQFLSGLTIKIIELI